MSKNLIQLPKSLPHPKPLQFGVRALFVLTAIVAVVVAGVRGSDAGILIAVFVLAAATSIWAFCTKHDIAFRCGIVGMISSALYLLLLPAMQASRGVQSNHSICQNKLKQIGLALLNYHEKHGRFPPAVVYDANGKPMHSWRTLILPEIEEGQLFRKYNFNEPWDSPYNKQVTRVQIECFQCSEDKSVGKFDTNYVALIGPDSIWSGKQGATLDDITDGPEQTMIVIELKNSGIHWAEPRDLDLDDLLANIDQKHLGESLSPHRNDVISVYADGHVEVIPFDVSIDNLKAAVSKSGRDTVDFSKQRNRIVPAPMSTAP